MNDAKYPPPAMAMGQNSAMVGAGQIEMHNPTIGENIDARIRRAEAQVVTLKNTREQMKASGLLDIRIQDLRMVMDY